ncbi:hypothetical protein N185_35360 [Sinorhizobium sp. GW3]|nr:hypothetical protein N185_35360 [Sinorhizobium sp. GW3]
MTTPYTTGSITLANGSAVVIGVGTAWQTALIAGGTIYVEADGNPLPILTVDGNTQITVAIKWKGASGTYPYAIMRDTAYGQQTVANAQALSTYLQRLDNPSLSALASLLPTADTLAYFNGAATAALTAFGADARALLAGGIIGNTQLPTRIRQTGSYLQAANDLDNVSQSGWVNVPSANVALVNGPPSAAGGGVLTLVFDPTTKVQIYAQVVTQNRMFIRYQAGTWSAWAEIFNSQTILGTVAQSAGVPTGKVIERGANANGEYVRFADGTQICNMRIAALQSCNISFGTMYYGSASFTFPNSFASAASIVLNGAARPGGQIVMVCAEYSTMTVSNGTVFLLSPLSFTNINTDLRLTAIGRWF